LIEIVEPIFFPLLPPMPTVILSIIDGCVMTAALAPLLYLLFVRRMQVQIELREQAEDEVRNVNLQLETLVNQRTDELLGTSRQLSRLVDEQRGTADSLDRINHFVQNVFEKAPCLILAFDAANRHCVYVNGGVTDLLGRAQDDVGVAADDVVDSLVWSADRSQFLKVLKAVEEGPEGISRHGACGFASATGQRVELAFGVRVLDRTPTQQAKSFLLTAMPTRG
jgi:PAS domain-containing protein